MNGQFFNSYLAHLLKAVRPKAEIEFHDQPYELSIFEKAAVVSVLTETVCKLSIINRGISGSAIRNEIWKEPEPMAVRFDGHFLEKFYDEKTLQPLREAFKTMTNVKLEQDIEQIRWLLEQSCQEFQGDGTLNVLKKFILAENREARDQYLLLKSHEGNKKLLDELLVRLKRCRDGGQQTIKNLSERLVDIERECEQHKQQHSMENSMVVKWERTRHEQVEAILRHELRQLDATLEELRWKTEREQRAMNDARNFNEVKCRKLHESIEVWSRRYEEEKEELDHRIEEMKGNIAEVQSKYGTIRGGYEERQNFIETYRTEQKIREEKRQFEAKQRNAAITIQSWWRGTMVRKQLGPYRPKKKSKKGGKGGKGGKKK